MGCLLVEKKLEGQEDRARYFQQTETWTESKFGEDGGNMVGH